MTSQASEKPSAASPVIELLNASVYFHMKTHRVDALRSASFAVERSERVALMGKSGSGKTTSGYCVLQLLKPTTGSVLFNGQELTKMRKAGLRQVRRDLQVVFQDPYASLNPRMTVGDIVSEPLLVHDIGDRRSRRRSAEQPMTRRWAR